MAETLPPIRRDLRTRVAVPVTAAPPMLKASLIPLDVMQAAAREALGIMQA